MCCACLKTSPTSQTRRLAMISATGERNSNLISPSDVRLHHLWMSMFTLLTFLLRQDLLLTVYLSWHAHTNPSPGECLSRLDQLVRQFHAGIVCWLLTRSIAAAVASSAASAAEDAAVEDHFDQWLKDRDA